MARDAHSVRFDRKRITRTPIFGKSRETFQRLQGSGEGELIDATATNDMSLA
jgi:hypothetical protein